MLGEPREVSVTKRTRSPRLWAAKMPRATRARAAAHLNRLQLGQSQERQASGNALSVERLTMMRSDFGQRPLPVAATICCNHESETPGLPGEFGEDRTSEGDGFAAGDAGGAAARGFRGAGAIDEGTR